MRKSPTDNQKQSGSIGSPGPVMHSGPPKFEDRHATTLALVFVALVLLVAVMQLALSPDGIATNTVRIVVCSILVPLWRPITRRWSEKTEYSFITDWPICPNCEYSLVGHDKGAACPECFCARIPGSDVYVTRKWYRVVTWASYIGAIVGPFLIWTVTSSVGIYVKVYACLALLGPWGAMFGLSVLLVGDHRFAFSPEGILRSRGQQGHAELLMSWDQLKMIGVERRNMVRLWSHNDTRRSIRIIDRRMVGPWREEADRYLRQLGTPAKPMKAHPDEP